MPPAARITDIHTCPLATPGTPPIPHVGGPVITGAPTVIVAGMPQARISDQCTCVGPPDVIVKGSATVLVAGMPAARLGDMTAHGGVITTGAPNVLIGEAGTGGAVSLSQAAPGAVSIPGAGGGSQSGTMPPPGPNGAEAGAAPGAAGNTASTPSLALAKTLIKTGGTGTQADADLVAQEMAKMPHRDLKTLKENGVSVVACRGSITNHYTDLKGVHPRGWPPGETWDSVPGVARGKVVTVAVIGHGTPAGPHVPAKGEGHGSDSLVFHEVAHALDNVSDTKSNSSSPAFTAARDKDIKTLSSYQTQPNPAGREETFAESYAGYHRNPSQYEKKHPNLSNYWKNR